VWDLPVDKLCDKHLLGEHRELHCIWIFITTDKGGSYKKHPETLRWVGRLNGLLLRHKAQVAEMEKRGWRHGSDPYPEVSPLEGSKPRPYQTLAQQTKILRAKGCKCKI